MAVTQFFDPFTKLQEGANVDSQIQGRNARTAVDLYSLQAMIDEKKNQQEYLRRTQQGAQAPPPGAPPGTPPAPQPSAADMVMKDLNDIDQRIQVATSLGLNTKVDQLLKIREATMGKYSSAVEREAQAKKKDEEVKKSNIEAVSRFASSAKAIFDDDKVSPADKVQSLQELDAAAKSENPMAYKALSGGKDGIDWSDPRTYNRMRSLEEQAIPPEKRREFALKVEDEKRKGAIQKEQIRKDDAIIAHLREMGDKPKLPVGKRWTDNTHSEMEDIPSRKTSTASTAGLSGQEYLDALPEDERGLIKSIADGKIDPKTLSTKGGHREDVLKKVAQYRSDYNQAKYAVYSAVQKDFTSGKAANNVTAINTAIGHMGTLGELASALENKDTIVINKIVNTVRNQLGDPRVNNEKTAASALGSEIMRVFRQVGASEKEQKDWESKYADFASPGQSKGALATGGHLLKSRIEALDDQWKRGMDSKDGFPNLLSPKSAAVLDKLGVKVDRGTEKPKEGKGAAKPFDDYLTEQEKKLKGGA